jgi:putative MATE family efflux protein
MDGEPVNRQIREPNSTADPSGEALVDGFDANQIPSYLHSQSGIATWREVLRLAWPVLARQFLILLVGLSDRYLAGHFHPHDESQQVSYQAAQTTANYLSWLIACYTVLVSVGSTALVARFVGAGNRRLAIRVTHQSIILAVVFGLAGSAAGLWGMDTLLTVLQLQGDSAKFAAQYLWPTFLLLTFEVVEQAGIACLAGAGDTLTGFWVTGGVAVINFPLAWGLCFGLRPLPELGFTGIAYGTALSHTIGASVIITMLARGRAGLDLNWRLLKPDLGLIWRLLRVSVPAAVDSMSLIVGQFWFLSIVNRLGEVASAAHGIALQWEAMGFLSGTAFGTAAMTLVGQNLGAGRPDRAAHSGWVAFRMGLGVMCTMGLIFFLLAEPMFSLFCPQDQQQPIVEAGVPVLQLISFAMPFVACTVVFTYALRGAGDTRVPVLFTWIGFVGVRIPLAYFFTMKTLHLGPLGDWLGCDWGLRGAWRAMFADLVIRGGLLFCRFLSGRWKGIEV